MNQEASLAKQEQVIDIEGRHIKISNLDKVLYPKVGFTKGQVIDYYVRIAPVLLPHLQGRPLTLKRYPNGVDGMFFYEKNCPPHKPDWVKTAKIWSEGNNRYMFYCTVADLPTLVWLGNLADLELHTSLSRSTNMQQPTVIAFGLDPGLRPTSARAGRWGWGCRASPGGRGCGQFRTAPASTGRKFHFPLPTPVR